jgi:acetamidase/formamidase
MTRPFARFSLVFALLCGAALAQTLPVLQPLADKPGPAPAGLNTGAGFYIPATADTVRWGALPDSQAKPILTVPSGAVITFDTVSHEGVLEDQGRNPVAFFGSFGVPPQSVLKDAQLLAASSLEHDFVKDGPHLVIGPVEVSGANPGDVVRIDIVSLTPRVPYGIISNRHGKGALPNEFPETPKPEPGADAAHPDLFHNVFRFVTIENLNGKMNAALKDANGRVLRFPIAPFQGTIGLTPNVSGKQNSVPPGVFGGNLDLRYLTAGSTLFLPVQIPGAMLFIADPHFAQGDGETALTAIEGSLRTTLRLTVLKQGDPAYPFKAELKTPFAETAEYWIPIGLDPDLNEAMKNAVRNAIWFLAINQGIDRATAMAYLSAATNFEVTQVVDKTKGVHALIRKADFGAAKTKHRSH